MAFLECSFYSHILGMESSANIILPCGIKSRSYEEENKDIPVLYLLHGFTEDHTVWMRRSSIERYVRDLNIAVVMPSVHRSFYIDMELGLQYFKFISEELPTLMSNMFSLSRKREDNFVAGLSMGGYGAFKTALSCPDKFIAAASLSGAVDINRVFNDDGYVGEAKAVFGDNVKPCNDLYNLAKNAKPMPYMYQCCGTEDFLYQDNIKFRDFVKAINPNYVFKESEGEHEWSFWDEYIQDALLWMKSINNRI